MSVDSQITVLIVDQHRMFGDVLAEFVGREEGLVVVGIETTFEGGLGAARLHQPDVVLAGFYLPNSDGVRLTESIKEHLPQTHIIMLTGSKDDHTLIRAIEAGVSGFITKDQRAIDVLATIFAAAAGEWSISPATLKRLLPRLRRHALGVPDLSIREREIVHLLAEGASSQAIAVTLALSVNTVRNHVQNILTKLGAHSRLEAVAKAARSGLLGTK